MTVATSLGAEEIKLAYSKNMRMLGANTFFTHSHLHIVTKFNRTKRLDIMNILIKSSIDRSLIFLYNTKPILNFKFDVQNFLRK